MIEFERTNEKGDRVKAYTHQSYLSNEYNSEVRRLQSRNQTWSSVTLYASTILSYWAFNNVASLRNFVQSKFTMRGRFLVASASVGLVNSFILSVILARSMNNTHESLLKKQVFPAWLQRDRCVNPERVFFELDDNNNNEPTIWHSSITSSTIDRIIPDFVVGTPQKPHYPLAEHHHH